MPPTGPQEAWIFDYVRTPRGKASPRGGLHAHTATDLVVHLMEALTDRGLDSSQVQDVILGCASQLKEQGANTARVSALLAGWGSSVPGMMVNRFCASGIDAVSAAAAKVRAGDADLVVAGGVETVSRVPIFSDGGPLWSDPEIVTEIGSIHMGVAADLNATLAGVTREQLDAYGMRSHQRAARAWSEQRFARSVVPMPATGGEALTTDELVRPQTNAASQAALAPAFAEMGAAGQDALVLAAFDQLEAVEHLHTVGTSPAMADGAALLVIGTLEAGSRAGLTPRGRIVAGAAVAGDPVRMLTAGQDAVQTVLSRNDVSAAEVSCFEFAEAFAALCLRFEQDMGIDVAAGDDRLNPNGGTIAMGHAFGATGAVMIGGCLEELEHRNGRWGVAAVSGAAGLGSALLIERPGGATPAAD
ncbi:putative 3-ketoacyl-CoA thiolase [Gordonia hirsuta DSM 44140 = NBRC 16056]|uniref:Putative 3-ketoacyl-CoA thiolase n=1 Tax=Gordonia hirsuta DSM 44140 = NBRC 16056 TaxID=1121927 RepID=L7L963_9ACTN|nr:acetyl-CoA C-acyltransferase [Gordonia hirsuta]GAC56582.1 putative 3-ketoacyl-CoA thiolase [Gordonia hirsuta DSM 44140 = NBRC 16056]